MKKRRTLIYIISILLLCVAGFLIYRSVSREPAPEYVFTYAENQSEGYPTSMGAYYFADLVRERTNGRIRIIVYPNGTLGREADVLNQMRYGGVDFARVSLSQLAELDPNLNVLQMPYLYNDADHMWAVLEGTIGEYFLEDVECVDLTGLSWYDAGARSFYTVGKPINRVSDIKGMKIRVQQSELMVDMMECLGAEAVPMSYEEVYAALELGTIDGAENNWPSYEDTGHYKVAKYFCEDEHTRIPEMQLCASHTFNMLSESDQEIIRECAKASALYERELWASRVEESRTVVQRSGIVITSISRREKELFREKMAPVYEKYCSEHMDIIDEILKAQ